MQIRLNTGSKASGSKADKGKKTGRSSSVAADDKKLTFQEHVDRIIPPDHGDLEALNRLVSQLPDLEKRLIDKRDDETLNEYKETIREIAGMTLKLNTRVQTLSRMKSNGVEVQQNYVKILDRRLHELTIRLSSKSSTAFQILKQMEEIRGLLIDMKS